PEDPMRSACLLAALVTVLGAPAAASGQEPMSQQAAQKLAQGTFREFLERLVQKRGFTTRRIENGGKPMLYAEWPRKAPGARTVLFYMHLDGQPVVDREWSQPSPWKPVVKKRNGAGWDVVASDALFGAALDPELRIFARSASDDKAPIMMFLAAFDGLKDGGADPAINVKVLLD